MGATESIQYKNEIIKSDIWPGCNIYQLETPYVYDEYKVRNTYKYSIEYISTGDDTYYNIPKNILFINKIGNDCHMIMKPDIANFTQTCMYMFVDFNDKEEPISSASIRGSECFTEYKGKKGVEGIMRLRYDLLNYVTNVLKYTNAHIKIKDVAEVPLKHALSNNCKKRLIISRMMNPHMRHFSIYDKYCEPVVYSREMQDIAEKMRNTRFDDVSIEYNCIMEEDNNNYAGKLLYAVLDESEAIKENDERYDSTNCSYRFVDLYYCRIVQPIDKSIIYMEMNNKSTTTHRQLTFNSLKKYFESVS